VELGRGSPRPKGRVTSLTARLDRLEEACAAVETGLSVDAGFTIQRFGASGAASTDLNFRTQRERLIDGMHKAGVPEG
jgi:hypothetical protein